MGMYFLLTPVTNIDNSQGQIIEEKVINVKWSSACRNRLTTVKLLCYSSPNSVRRLAKKHEKKNHMNDVKAKQQIVDKIKASTNILVTVSDSPSVDALSAALGMTMALDRMGKHATAIFSGTVPAAISFLDPEKTFEATTDSLRDFIIALDKEKADHLRYKLEGDMVKIFITPYKTTITSDDLEFSQGDYNVELVMALGVDVQEHLDKAMEAHGQILHDAAVVTITAGEQASKLGSIDWHDPQASGLCEMLVSLLDSMKAEGDKEALLDQPSATALLTGIVAETERFSNNKTSSKVMTIAAELMAAGADQQLIASKLQSSPDLGTSEPSSEPEADENAYGVKTDSNGEMSISHDDGGETLADLDKRVRGKDEADQASSNDASEAPAETVEPVEATTAAPAETDSSAYTDTPADSAPEVKPSEVKISGAYALEPTEAEAEAQLQPTPAATEPDTALPSPAEEPAHKYIATPTAAEQDDALLKHAYLPSEPADAPQVNAAAQVPSDTAPVDIFSGNSTPPPATVSDPLTPPADAPAVVPPPVSPDMAATMPEPPPLPDFSKLPPPTSLGGSAGASPVTPSPTPDILGDILNDNEQTPPPAPQPPVGPQPAAPNDPGQFQIPGGNPPA